MNIQLGFEAIVERGLLSEDKPCDLPVQNYKQINVNFALNIFCSLGNLSNI